MKMTDIKADKKAFVQGEGYRFTVLTPCMIRMEYSRTNEFVDSATQMAANRRFPVPEFRVEETKEQLVIKTSKLRLKYNKKAFSPYGLEVRLNNNYPGAAEVWHYGEEPKDLLGTARTLDEADGAIPLEHGLLSHAGFSLLEDKGSMLLREDGWIDKRRDKEAEDIYFLGYGRNYLECLRDFYQLTGQVPLVPRFALGNWWSRYYPYSEQTYQELLDRFQKDNLPFTVAVLDIDWHLRDLEPGYGTGWTGYTWNRELFPDPEGFMQNLHDRGMKVTLNVHPADGVRAFEDCYEAFARYMGIDPEGKEPVDFRIGDPKFVKGYLDCVHHPLEEQGVDFWWIDWQQGTNSGIQGLDPLWMLNHYHYLDNERDGKCGLIFSRYAGPGSHRYPVGFSGDTVVSWESLDFQPYFTANASNIGYGWWSNDIGGHMHGIKDDELEARWVQFGAFSPVLRLHSTDNEFNGKEPWRYHAVSKDVAERFLRLRHRMIPYLYTMDLKASREGIPLMQPMYYQNPMDEEAYQVPNEYYFGSELIACPITSPAGQKNGMGRFAGWLPEGTWMDFFTGMIYQGGRRMDFYRDIYSIPVLARAGAIVPMDAARTGNAAGNPENLELHVFAGDSGAFTLWENDCVSQDTDLSVWAGTKIELLWPGQTQLIIHAPEGKKEVLPEKRTYTVVLHQAAEGLQAKIRYGAGTKEEASCVFDRETGLTTICLEPSDLTEDICIFLENASLAENALEERVWDFLNSARFAFDLKKEIMDVVRRHKKEGKSLTVILGILLTMNLDPEILGPLAEILTA